MTTSEHAENRDERVTSHASPFPVPRKPEEVGLDRPTMGLITAMPEEFVAMRALLDDASERDIPRDPARYVRGTLPSKDAGQCHDVVLTQLGATGTNAAANGCAHLARSFPSITVVIMVGTAAGVPSPYRPELHVRVGDIVVATHGIADYDHVRVVAGGVQPRAQFPSPSPQLSRCADMLKVDEIGGQRPWEEWLDTKRLPGLAGYSRPPEYADILYDGAGRRLWHPPRELSGHRRGFPKLHHGLIGSADRALSDAIIRDQLAEQHGFLALEMEGAGIGSSSFLNSLEWFVVRGISDYGDSQRDLTWRRYASLAAAAYARALLAKCLPLEPDYVC